jgi:chromosome partitioning protein
VTRTIAVANQKGGVAKTTTVASVGVALAELGRRVLVIDLDPQACLTFSLGVDPDAIELSIHDVFMERVGTAMAVRPITETLDLLPSTIDLTGSEVALHDRAGREYVLRSMLDDIKGNYEFILIDCSPSLGVLTINALTASDEVLIPLQCETLSHRGVGQLLDTIGDVRRLTNKDLVVLGVLPTLYDGRTTHARAVLADVTERFGVPVLEPPIGRSIRFAEAPASGESIMATAATSPGAMAYREHARRLSDEGVAA